VGGNNQTGVVGEALPIALQAGLQNPYTAQPVQTPGIPVTFSAAGKVGVFSNPNPTTDSSGTASTTYTLPAKPGTYTITASSPGYASATFLVTAVSDTATALVVSGGNLQKAPVLTALSAPLKVKAKDTNGNGVAGVVVTFADNGAGGSFSATTATTDSSGVAGTTYVTGTRSGAVKISASASGLTPAVFKQTVLAGPAVSLAIKSGNNQTVGPGTVAPKKLQVLVEDQYGNPVPGVSLNFSDAGAGGSLSPNPVVTNAKGIAATTYATPAQPGQVTVTASSPGLSPVAFTINVSGN
jgi:protocatechuate 3,4-dioxygenase beta subunit